MKKELSKAKDWQSFIAKHCKCSHYSFQVKKCTSVNCFYCHDHPTRIPDFSEVNFLPDPEPTPDNLHYLSFEQMYGKKTTDSHRPSLHSVPVEKESDRQHRALLVAARVRDVLICSECSKPRCVYAASKLSYDERTEVQKVRDEGVYLCGVPLFPDTHPLRHSVVVREALNCSAMVEATYYGSPRVCFDACCVHCGTSEDLLDNEEVKEARRHYHTVRPICWQCKSQGKSLVTRGPMNHGVKKPRLDKN